MKQGPKRLAVTLVILQLTGILCYDYLERVELPNQDRRMSLHQEIVSGEAPYQYRYRILIPYVAEELARTLNRLAPARWAIPYDPHPYSKKAFGVAYLILNAAAIWLFLFGVQALAQTWFSRQTALAGTVLAALVMELTFRDHYFHPWSFWEAAFFSLGLLYLSRRRFGWFTLINVLGVLNRETSVFLCASFAFLVLPARRPQWSTYLRRTDVRFAFANGLIWLIGFTALHLLVGYRPSTFTVAGAIAGNLDRWTTAVILNGLLFGPAWLLVLRGLWRGPAFLRRVALVLPFYLGLLLVIGFWWEIRYWLTVLPILIPALLCGVESPRADTEFPSG